jgi:hypothetical protein
MISGMKAPGSPSPIRLVCWFVIGGALALSSFLALLLVPVPADRSERLLIRGVIGFVPFCIGIAISLVAMHRLRRGLNNNAWTEAELAPLRTQINHPAWTLLILLSIVTYVGSAIVSDLDHGTTLRSALMILVIWISQVKAVMKPREVAGEGGLLSLDNSKHLQSSHWGRAK